jgi:hypothetical protein
VANDTITSLVSYEVNRCFLVPMVGFGETSSFTNAGASLEMALKGLTSNKNSNKLFQIKIADTLPGRNSNTILNLSLLPCGGRSSLSRPDVSNNMTKRIRRQKSDVSTARRSTLSARHQWC